MKGSPPNTIANEGDQYNSGAGIDSNDESESGSLTSKSMGIPGNVRYVPKKDRGDSVAPST